MRRCETASVSASSRSTAETARSDPSAPEILAAGDPTPRSDQFSLACTLWEALAGERLFQAKTDVEVFTMIRNGEVRSLE